MLVALCNNQGPGSVLGSTGMGIGRESGPRGGGGLVVRLFSVVRRVLVGVMGKGIGQRGSSP